MRAGITGSLGLCTIPIKLSPEQAKPQLVHVTSVPVFPHCRVTTRTQCLFPGPGTGMHINIYHVNLLVI
ncbi:hypothetical protein MGG_15610 [Pyricularia oryzae 70-15]|uniref:Uncharacterized protein n=2 Tax=Pyricularia oryzae TaxID=318829 RepID=G4MVN6_PYRO7|nr:uncharacterized protein MGG_15610 [Pyricularia oryzae 70-15]EHA54145.1 hypothetical protein MGG_15610 [Pyricularia oryzae 70-15]